MKTVFKLSGNVRRWCQNQGIFFNLQRLRLLLTRVLPSESKFVSKTPGTYPVAVVSVLTGESSTNDNNPTDREEANSARGQTDTISSCVM